MNSTLVKLHFIAITNILYIHVFAECFDVPYQYAFASARTLNIESEPLIRGNRLLQV